MNIISYVTSISMEPKRYVCGLYKNHLTLKNVRETGEFVLQLLSADQANLVNLLGKKSGLNIDKISRLERRKLLSDWSGYKVLNDCLAVIKLKVLNEFEAGDHVGFLLDVIDYKNINEGEPLTLDTLREKKIIRA